MREVGIYEAKVKLSELLERVEAGQEITITNHGRPVARLVAVPTRTRKQLRDLIEETKSLRRNVKIGRVSLRKIVEDGRR